MSSQVIILGMHRSGTSLTGQVLEALGFHFGPADLAATPKKDNPLGYWERKDTIALNSDAFAALGKTWVQIGRWDAAAIPDSFRQEFDARAQEIIAAYPEGEPWFMKDPRICVTLPLWEKHLKNPVYLFVYRDPVEIARSLWSRNRHSPAPVMALWERYLGDALNATQGKPRFLLRYADLMRDPAAAVADLSSGLRALGAVPPNSVETALERIAVDRSLRHHSRAIAEPEITFTLSQEMLNRSLQDGTAFELPGQIDVSEANCRLNACEDLLALGEIPPLSPSRGEEKPLKALETVYALYLHYKRASPLSPVSGEFALATLVPLCDRLCHRNPFQTRRSKAKHAFLEYTANLPKTPFQFIKKAKIKTEIAWARELINAGALVEGLLGELILGRIPQSPDAGSAERVKGVMASLDALLLGLGKAAGEGRNARYSGDPAKDREDMAKLLDWGTALCHWNPLNSARQKAVKEFKAYQAGRAGKETVDPERVRAIASVVEAARDRLAVLLRDLEEPLPAAQRLPV